MLVHTKLAQDMAQELSSKGNAFIQNVAFSVEWSKKAFQQLALSGPLDPFLFQNF